MVRIDDIVTYGTNGVCKVVEIGEKDLMGTKKNYVVLKPLNDDKSTYYIPTDNASQLEKLHRILSEDEINQLIDSMPNEKILWINNERERKERYRQIIADGNHSELIKMIKALHFEKKSRAEKGKKLHIADERFLKDAEKILYDEFQYVLNLSEKDVMSYIVNRIENK